MSLFNYFSKIPKKKLSTAVAESSLTDREERKFLPTNDANWKNGSLPYHVGSMEIMWKLDGNGYFSWKKREFPSSITWKSDGSFENFHDFLL